jgi:anionic cell wall polymer biosynthesis LytR-Cps2A-Psr (LCP) family protein
MRVPVQKPAPTPPPAEKKRRRFRLSFKAGFRLAVFALLVLAGWAAYTLFTSIPKRFTVLVIGSDQRAEERGRSDVLMVVSLPRSPRDSISILTIPRDTRVEVPGFGMQKITHAYALGDIENDGKTLGNRRLTEETVERFLGIPIDATIELTFASFEAIINKLGGVTTQKYGTLTGKEALKIVRDRAREGGDFARTADQRDILFDVVEEIKRQNAYTSMYEFLKESGDARMTFPRIRFTVFSVYAIIRRAGNFHFTDAHTEVIPGKGESMYTPEFQKNLYYWVPDEEKTQRIIEEWFARSHAKNVAV